MGQSKTYFFAEPIGVTTDSLRALGRNSYAWPEAGAGDAKRVKAIGKV